MSLVYNTIPHDQLSLVDLKYDFLAYIENTISKVAIHKKFTPEALSFLKEILNQLLSFNLAFKTEAGLSHSFFSCINIKDSSKFKLPLTFLSDYPSYGSYNKLTAFLNLQFEFDAMTGNWNCVELTKATRNDQTDSKETSGDIQERGLYIRDLGYITTTYLLAVGRKNAYYLNRLPKIGVYQLVDQMYKPIDWNVLDKKIKQARLPYYEMEAYLGKEERIKTRMIISPVPKNVTEERIRKAKQGGKRTNGYQISKEYKVKAQYNIFITNVPQDILSEDDIIKTYKLRWQIELIFKTWKSNLQIHKVKAVRTIRMECQLIAKLIWILLNTRLHQLAQFILWEKLPGKGCSQLKFFKLATKFSKSLLQSIVRLKLFQSWFNNTIIPILPDLIIEKRLTKDTNCLILNSLLMI